MSASETEGWTRPVFEVQTADDLRELITQAELIVANLRGAGERVQTLLFLLDKIAEYYASLGERGIDLRAEATRIETVHRLLLASDGVLVRQMGQVGGLAKAREAVKPAPERWWWYLDQRVAERRERLLRRALMVGAGVLGALLVVGFAINKLFPVDPRRAAAMEKTSLAEQAYQAGDIAKALEYYRQAAAALPEEADPMLWIGVLEEKQGNNDAAEQAYAAAEKTIGDHARYVLQRGMIRAQVGAIDQAEADAEAALAEQPDMAEAYFLLGGVYEARGDVPAAIAAFEKTAELAGNQNNSALIVMAKTREGMLMQSAPMMVPTPPTPTPEAGS